MYVVGGSRADAPALVTRPGLQIERLQLPYGAANFPKIFVNVVLNPKKRGVEFNKLMLCSLLRSVSIASHFKSFMWYILLNHSFES